jgi:hypothetical protein
MYRRRILYTLHVAGGANPLHWPLDWVGHETNTFLGPEMAAHVHKITNVPVLMILMGANPLLGLLEKVGPALPMALVMDLSASKS